VLIVGCSSIINTPEQTEIHVNPIESATEPLLSQTPAIITPQYNEYTVKLDVCPKERMVTGVERIKIFNTSKQVLDKVYIIVPLNAFSENAASQPVFDEFLNKVYPKGKNYGYMIISNVNVDGELVKFEQNDTIVRVNLPTPLPPDEWAELRMDLKAKIPMMNHRTGSDENSMWFGNFLPILAVCDDDGWHINPYYPAGNPFFSRTANFNVRVTTPIEYTVVGPGIPQITDKGDKKTTEFSSRLARDFAFTLSRHYYVESITSTSNVEIRLYTFSDFARKDELLEITCRSLEYYISRVGAYPYSQLILVETRMFNKGGMEYPGIIFIDSDYMLSRDFADVTRVIGHQWFYNIIGSNQIKNAWMKEGLNSFIHEGFYLDEAELDKKMQDEYNKLQSVISQIEPNTLRSSLGEFTSWSDYYSIHYIRGKLMFYSLYKEMGHENFDLLLTEYNQQFSFRIAAPDDLIQIAEDISGLELSMFFNAWIDDPVLPIM
jgi:hypothetical protein